MRVAEWLGTVTLGKGGERREEREREVKREREKPDESG